MTTKSKQNFTSYLIPESENSNEDNENDVKPKLLNGEIIVASAKNVLLYPPTCKMRESDDENIDEKGHLFITNFKLTFITTSATSHANKNFQHNEFLGDNDVTLSNIESIFQITDRKKKLIGPQIKVNSKIDAIKIVCKNFRVLKFGFRQSDVGKGKNIAEAIAKFAYINQHDLLFLYRYREKYYNTQRNIPMFDKKSDWVQEMSRCGAANWHIISRGTEVDSVTSKSMPPYFVVPKSIYQSDYLKLANHFRGGRAAIWVYNLENASLVRMAELLPTIPDGRYENTVLEHVRICDPNKGQPALLELNKILPSIQDVQLSYVKLRDLCTPDTTGEFMFQDNRFYGLLEKTYWYLYVSLCLKYSTQAAERMQSGETVVLQENDGRDMCCVISSLIQIILDPHYRTLIGFQTLIQKEWVALGHPFSDRLGHVINKTTTEQSPLFLLFLDSVWQLLQQFPERFEFTETFLTTLWDSAFLAIFDTFQFNCDLDRVNAAAQEQVILRPLWDWAEQFNERDILLFLNPLYKRANPIDTNRKSVFPPNSVALPGLTANSRITLNLSQLHSMATTSTPTNSTNQDRFLKPKYALMDLDIWTQCYYRWMPILAIESGGYPQIDLFNRKLLSNITRMQEAIQTQGFKDVRQTINDIDYIDDERSNNGTSVNSDKDTIPSVDSFFPFSCSQSQSNELTKLLNENYLAFDVTVLDKLSIYQGPD